MEQVDHQGPDCDQGQGFLCLLMDQWTRVLRLNGRQHGLWGAQREHGLAHWGDANNCWTCPRPPGQLRRNCLGLQGGACEAQKTLAEKQRCHTGKDAY